MVAQTFHVINKLSADIFFKFRRQIVNRTCKHEVLPYDKAQLIAKIIEPVFRIIAAAPYTDRIEIRPFTLLQQAARRLRCDPSEQVILRNVICTHCKDIHSIDADCKILAPFIL